MSAVLAVVLVTSLEVSCHEVASNHIHQQYDSQRQHIQDSPLPISHCHMQVVQTDHKSLESSTQHKQICTSVLTIFNPMYLQDNSYLKP